MATTIQVDENGDIHIPSEFGIQPRDRVIVNKIDGMVVIKKPQKEIGEKISKILQKTMKTAAWKEIEEGRKDRKW